MRFVTNVKYIEEYRLAITFDNHKIKIVDLKDHLGNGVFKPLSDLSYFKTVQLNSDLDTITWDNGADVSPDFLYEIGKEVE